jgi:hypothetical protein
MHQATMTQYITLAVDISESSAMNQYTTSARIVADAMVKERAEQPHATLAGDSFTMELAAQFLSIGSIAMRVGCSATAKYTEERGSRCRQPKPRRADDVLSRRSTGEP